MIPSVGPQKVRVCGACFEDATPDKHPSIRPSHKPSPSMTRATELDFKEVDALDLQADFATEMKTAVTKQILKEAKKLVTPAMVSDAVLSIAAHNQEGADEEGNNDDEEGAT